MDLQLDLSQLRSAMVLPPRLLIVSGGPRTTPFQSMCIQTMQRS